MGYLSAYDTIDLTKDLANSVSIHLSSNCYPPVPQYMVPVAVEAIQKVLAQEDYALIDLPEGVTFRNETSVRAINVVDTLHLFPFVDWFIDNDLAEGNLENE